MQMVRFSIKNVKSNFQGITVRLGTVRKLYKLIGRFSIKNVKCNFQEIT